MRLAAGILAGVCFMVALLIAFGSIALPAWLIWGMLGGLALIVALAKPSA